MFGDYELDGDTLVVGELAMTMMGCPDGLAEQDAWVGDLLAAGPTVAETDGTLTVTSGTTVITLLDRKIADPDRPLVGTLWRVETLISNDAASSTPGGAEATLTFNEDGTDLGATFWGRTVSSQFPSWGIEPGEQPGVVAGVFGEESVGASIEVQGDSIGEPVLRNANAAMAVKVLA